MNGGRGTKDFMTKRLTVKDHFYYDYLLPETRAKMFCNVIDGHEWVGALVVGPALSVVTYL